MRFVVLANPENRRCASFLAAVEAAGLPAPRVLAWREHLAQGPGALAAALDACDVLRIESPGEDAEVERALLARGADQPDPEGLGERLSAREVAGLALEPGRVRAGRQWFLGFRAALSELDEVLAGRPALNAPRAIVELFDKAASQRSLREAGVSVPEALGASPRSFAELEAALEAAGWSRVYVKPRHGSSASGVVALARSRDGRLAATTSAELVRGPEGVALYNSLQVRRLTARAEVAALLDVLCAEGVHVERWIPKASLGGPCDLRVLTVGGAPQHAVVRVGRTTLTNLHLGNARGDLDALRARAGEERWGELQALVAQAAAVYPEALYLGADVALAQGFGRAFVLELNAFGDLLPRLTWGGRDTYGAVVAAALARWRAGWAGLVAPRGGGRSGG